MWERRVGASLTLIVAKLFAAQFANFRKFCLNKFMPNFMSFTCRCKFSVRQTFDAEKFASLDSYEILLQVHNTVEKGKSRAQPEVRHI